MPKNYSNQEHDELDIAVERARKLFMERLAGMREKRGMTQEALAEKMNCSAQSMSNWERKSPGLSLSGAIRLSKILECDMDYLVGNVDETTHDIHFVHEYTGLSEKAIRKIGPPGNNPNAYFLNHLIEADGFQDFMNAYGTFMVAIDRLGKAVISEPTPYPVDQDGNIVIDGSVHSDDGSRITIGQNSATFPLDKAARYVIQEVAQAIMRLCEPDFQESYAKCMKKSKRTGGKDNGQH